MIRRLLLGLNAAALLACSGLAGLNAENELVLEQARLEVEEAREIALKAALEAEDAAAAAAREAEAAEADENRPVAQPQTGASAPAPAPSPPRNIPPAEAATEAVEEGSELAAVPFDQIDAIIRNDVGIRACFAEWERHSPTVKRMNVTMTLSPQGKAKDVRPDARHKLNPLGACIQTAVEGMSFPKGKRQTFTYPVMNR
jgi:hypothetical protein